MIFDKFCWVAERQMPDLVPVLQRARLFVFEEYPDQFLPKTFTAEQASFWQDTFFLPFPVVAIEDAASCVVIQDETKDQIGLSKPRIFFECASMHPDHQKRLAGVSEEDIAFMSRMVSKDTFMVRISQIDEIIMNPENSKIELSIIPFMSALIDENGPVFPIEQTTRMFRAENEFITCAMRSAKTAIEEVIYFNAPDKFILEKSPASPRKCPKGRIPRSSDRPIYTVMTPGEIRKKMRIGQGEVRHGVRMHERRRHLRVLRSEKFVHSRGKTIVIPATWVGTTENVVGNHRYKVRVDL